MSADLFDAAYDGLCPTCQGSGGGPDPSNRCQACQGTGEAKRKRDEDPDPPCREPREYRGSRDPE